MNKTELIKAIMDYLLNTPEDQRTAKAHEHFSDYIYSPFGDYAANGREISSFIYEADRLLYNTL